MTSLSTARLAILLTMLTTLFDDIFVAVRKNSGDETQKALNAFLEWKEVNGMSYNTTKYKELSMAKKGVTPNFPPPMWHRTE